MTRPTLSLTLAALTLAFQVGLVGFALYALGVVALLFAIARLANDARLPRPERLAAIAFLGGLVSFLVVNASNPYLAKFDYMWTLFIPLGLVRLYAGRCGVRRLTGV